MNIDLVMATLEDIEFLRRLRKLTMVEHLAAMGIFLSDAEHEQRITDAFDCSHIICVAGRPLGLVKFSESEDQLEIMQLQILPESQGMGIGRRLIESFIERAASKNQRVILSVLKRNPAKKLYERLGFTVVGEDEHEFHLQLDPRDLD